MSNELYSRFQRTLGVIEGISLGLNNDIGNALLEQCDVLDAIADLSHKKDKVTPEGQIMEFPKTVDEFMESYKIVDTEEVYTNGSELVPIFRMKQWFDHLEQPVIEKTNGEWLPAKDGYYGHVMCSACHCIESHATNFCPFCGADMRSGGKDDVERS